MKKLLIVAAAFAFVIVLASAAFTEQGAGGISRAKDGLYLNWKFPDSTTYSETVEFPTPTSSAPSWVGDSISLKVGKFYTYVLADSMVNASTIYLYTQPCVTGGATLSIEATSSGQKNLYIVQTSTRDTIQVNNRKRLAFQYNGSKWVPTGSF